MVFEEVVQTARALFLGYEINGERNPNIEQSTYVTSGETSLNITEKGTAEGGMIYMKRISIGLELSNQNSKHYLLLHAGWEIIPQVDMFLSKPGQGLWQSKTKTPSFFKNVTGGPN